MQSTPSSLQAIRSRIGGSAMGFWSRHRRKIFVAVGALGCGYALYKLYDSYRRRLIGLGMEIVARRRAEEQIREKLQTHFENIQRISETTTLPHAMSYLRSQIAAELDVSEVTDKLMKEKGQTKSLQPKEKLELWERLKIISFTKAVLSLWATTVLFLYIRAQVNILGRQLYLEAARGFGTFNEQDEANPFDRHGQQEFLATADYLSNYGIGPLITEIEHATHEVLKDKQLTDPFSLIHLSETIMKIIEVFMNSRSLDSWINYMVPENAVVYQQLLAMSSTGFHKSNMLMDTSKLEQLIAEARAVLSSFDFRKIIDLTTRTVVGMLMQDLAVQLNDTSLSDYPLAKLLPRVERLGPALLEEAHNNRYIKAIRSLPEVELFYTLLYANTSQATVVNADITQKQHPQNG